MSDSLKIEESMELARKCKSGCRDSHNELYRKFKGTVSSICKRYTKNQEEAEDIAQECFVKIFNRIGDYRGEGSLEGWVKRVAVNLSITEYNRRKRFWYTDDIDSKFDISDNSYKEMDPEYRMDEINPLIEKLPEGYRKIFELYAIEGYKHKEIAEMLDIDVNTSKSQFFRGRERLKSYLEKI